jgi:hypothetical protein
MRDGDRRAAGHQHVQRVADEQFGFGVDAGRGFVEDQHARIEGERAREREQLFLADRQRRAALGHRARVAVRQPLDERLGVHGPRRLAHAFVVNRELPSRMLSAIVPENRCNVLQHQAGESANLARSRSRIVHAVDRDPPPLHVVEAQEQIDQRRLAGPGGPDNADALARAAPRS